MHTFHSVTSVLGAACHYTHSCYQELIRKRGLMRDRKTPHRNPTDKRSLTIPTPSFFLKHICIYYILYIHIYAKSLQLCPTLRDPIDGSPTGFPVPGILQARTLEWVAISFSKAWKWKVKVKSLSRVRLLVTPWTAAYRAPPPIGFSRQKYWSGVP